MVTRKTNPRPRLLGIAVGVLVMIVIAVVAIQLRPGITVTVKNTGTTPLKAVVLHVTGASHNLGDIAPGAFATASLRPSGESDLQVEFVDGGGPPQRLRANCYIESGYRGAIQVEIKDGQIDKLESHVKVW
jgi:hypothetical protein